MKRKHGFRYHAFFVFVRSWGQAAEGAGESRPDTPTPDPTPRPDPQSRPDTPHPPLAPPRAVGGCSSIILISIVV